MTRKQRYWEKYITAWQDSGLSQAAYCREHDFRSKLSDLTNEGLHPDSINPTCPS